ncbi:MAG: hypothetical protein ACOCZB_07550 [Spirochaetota bacterium]
MTKQEARDIYDLQIALAQTFRRDIFELCERKGVPEEWVIEFLEDDLTYDRFFARHNVGGELQRRSDVPRARLLKEVVRAALLGRDADDVN